MLYKDLLALGTVITFISVTWHAASLARIWEMASGWQVGALFYAFLKGYEDWMNMLAELIEPVILFPFRHFWPDLALQSHWKHIFVLLAFYSAMHGRSAKSEGNYAAARFVWIWGTLVALVSSVGAGIMYTEDPVLKVAVAGFAVVGVVVYGAGNSVRAATFYREHDAWATAFLKSFRHSKRFATVGVGAIVFWAIAVSHFESLTTLPHPGLALVFLLVIGLALYRISVGPYWGWYKIPKPGTSRLMATLHSSEARIGFLMLASILIACGFFLLEGAKG